MKINFRSLGFIGFGLLFLFSCSLSALAQRDQPCTTLGGANPNSYTQDFDGLGDRPGPKTNQNNNLFRLSSAPTETWLGLFDNTINDNDAAVDLRWAVVEQGPAVNSAVTGRYNAGNGTMSEGNTFTYGNSSDRALGSQTAANITTNWMGACFVNGTGAIGFVSIGYTGEMWRRGTAGTHVTSLKFQYLIKNNTTGNIFNAGTFTSLPGYDFVTPNVSGTAGSRDGNAAENRTVFPLSLMPFSLNAGEVLYVRWVDEFSQATALGVADDGLAIDDFSISLSTTTSAPVSVSGRVIDANGRGIGQTRIEVRNTQGIVKTAITNAFGYYNFQEVPVGNIYFVEASSKQHTFIEPVKAIQLDDSIVRLDFIATPPVNVSRETAKPASVTRK